MVHGETNFSTFHCLVTWQFPRDVGKTRFEQKSPTEPLPKYKYQTSSLPNQTTKTEYCPRSSKWDIIPVNPTQPQLQGVTMDKTTYNILGAHYFTT